MREARAEPGQHMAKIYELYRNQKSWEGSEAQRLERFGGGGGARSP